MGSGWSSTHTSAGGGKHGGGGMRRGSTAQSRRASYVSDADFEFYGF